MYNIKFACSLARLKEIRSRLMGIASFIALVGHEKIN